MSVALSKNLPLTLKGVESFLAGRHVSGIGPAYARRLVERFGIDAVRVLRDTPHEAEAIPGLGASRVAEASESLRNMKWPLDFVVFLSSCGVSEMFIDRIFNKYGRHRAERILETDPYSMVEDVWQLSFYTADKIGRALGVNPADPRRLRGAIVGAVKHFAEAGHLFATPDEAVNYAASMCGVASDLVPPEIDSAVADGRIVKSRGGLYLPVFYKAEKEASEKILRLAATSVPKITPASLPTHTRAGQPYSQEQSDAILQTLNTPVAVLTGGPGSGKTTVLCGVIEALEKEGKKVVLAAPTGRAAKRMTALTGSEASTIHRLLGYRMGEGFIRRHIDADALIIDEGSMMEQVLFNHLLDAIGPGTRLILVGDVDQLPAIGAGNVLKDMIDSGSLPVISLDGNFRQEKGSLIAAGAGAIRHGEMPQFDSERDLMIVEADGVRAIHDCILRLVSEELPATRGLEPTDIMVVTPQQIGPLGARNLNVDLQKCINPIGPALRRGETVIRLGDPVMQTANSSERGLYNGETGRVSRVDTETQSLEVTFADGRKSVYLRSELSELVLAYATTVHKLQGSETKNMIFPITMTHKPMLYRSLLYTAVSRATDLCVLVGEKEALRYALENNPATGRRSNFRYRLRPISD